LATEHGIATMFLSIRLLEGMTMDIHLFFPSPMFKTKSRVRITILVGNSGSLLVNLPSGYLAVCYGKWSIYYKWIKWFAAIFHSYVEYSEGRVRFCLTSEISRWWLGSGKGLTVSGNMSVS
jgi:hypothetical protein